MKKTQTLFYPLGLKIFKDHKVSSYFIRTTIKQGVRITLGQSDGVIILWNHISMMNYFPLYINKPLPVF